MNSRYNTGNNVINREERFLLKQAKMDRGNTMK